MGPYDSKTGLPNFGNPMANGTGTGWQSPFSGDAQQRMFDMGGANLDSYRSQPNPYTVPGMAPMPSVNVGAGVGAGSMTSPAHGSLGDVTEAQQTAWDAKGWLGKSFTNKGGGLNFDAVGSVMDSIGSFGKLYAGLQMNKIAKESLGFQKYAFGKNLEAKTLEYNTNNTDRTRARFAQAGKTQRQADKYSDTRKLG